MARLFVGTYTKREDHVAGHGEGIYAFHLDESTWTCTPGEVTRDIINPSFLALSPSGAHLYAASEVTEEDGRLYAYAVDGEAGSLRALGFQTTRGAAPCYVALTERHALVANYLGGSVAVFPIQPDGNVGPSSDRKEHRGSSVNEMRQEGPHPHAIVPDATGTYVCVPDLGTDTVTSYRLNAKRGRLKAASSPLPTDAGAGPRHLAFHPCGQAAYLINELDATVVACYYDQGELTPLQTVSLLPRSFGGTPSGADIHVDPSGRFVYASLRCLSSIVRMRVDPSNGELRGKAYAHVLGTTPRNFAISPDGQYLVVANQDSDSLVVMVIDQATGTLTPVGTPMPVPSPACVVIAP